MADVKWIKIVTDIFDDEKIKLIESNPDIADSVIVIWFKLLCLAGKCNNSGVFMLNERIAFTDDMLATIFRRNQGTVKIALDTFERFGMIEVVNNVITIPNWSKHQNLDQLEERKEYMKDYMQKYREKQKLITDGNIDNNNDGKVNSEPLHKVNSKVNVNTLDKKREEKKREEKETDIKKDMYFKNDEKLDSTFFDFIEMRKKIKSPMTDKAIELMIKKLNKFDSETAIAMLEQSIVGSWKDIYPIKDNKQANIHPKGNKQSVQEVVDIVGDWANG